MSNMNPPLRKKGTPKTGGRKKGTPNKATVEAKAACAEIVDDPRYRRRLLAKARVGTLPPPVECMFWHYAKGKPKETIAHEGGLDVKVSRKEQAEAHARSLSTADLKKVVALYDEIAAITGRCPSAGFATERSERRPSRRMNSRQER